MAIIHPHNCRVRGEIGEGVGMKLFQRRNQVFAVTMFLGKGVGGIFTMSRHGIDNGVEDEVDG